MHRSGRTRIHVETLEDRTLPSFVSAQSFAVGPKAGAGSKPAAVVSGDFNRDGKLDVATANTGADGISVLLGLGNGQFKPATNLAIGHAPVAMIAVDVNGDGKLDLVTADKSDNLVTVLLGNGAGSFKVAGAFAAGAGPVAIASGDFNDDGHTDLAVADNGASNVTILLGNGKGSFTPGATVAVGNNPTSVAAADFNGDLRPDIATVSGGFGHLDINLNNGDGTFAAPVNYATGFVANTVVVGDFNGDPYPDLAVACNFPSTDGVSILLGNPDGTFQPFTKYDAGGQTPRTLAVGDFNGDGIQDLVTANDQFANNSVSVLPGNGDGSFGPARVFTAGEGPVGIAVGDFNRDGVLDAVTADTGTAVGSGGPIGTVTLLLGNGDGTLVASPDLTVAGPGAIVAGDLTGDGIPDLAVVTTNVSYSGVTIFPGEGDGNFGSPLPFPVIVQPTGIAIGDFDGNHTNDLAVTTSSGVTVFLNDGNGTFSTKHDYGASGSPTWVAVDDFNGDQNPDLAVADGNGVSILLGNGDGTFGPATNVSAGGAATYVATADFNGDNKRDLAVVNGSANTVTILFGQGDGSFTLSTPSYATMVGPGSVSVGDFNRDGKPDLAVPTFFGNGASSGLAILTDGASGKFAAKGEYGTDSRPIGSVVADFTGDNLADIALANNFADDLMVFGGKGNGTFATPTRYVVGDRPTWIATADFNGDGKPDIAVVNSNSGTVTLLETPTAATHFRVNVLKPAVTAGTAVQVVVSALDAAGHLVPGFTGPVTLTSTDAHALLPAAHFFTAADHGTYAFTATLRTAATQNITARAAIGSGSGSLQVLPGVATHLAIVASPANPTAGTAFDLTILALDRYGNVAPTFAGTVHLTTTDRAAGISIPPDYTFAAGDQGMHTFTGGVTLMTPGKRTITVTTVGAHISGKLTVTVSA